MFKQLRMIKEVIHKQFYYQHLKMSHPNLAHEYTKEHFAYNLCSKNEQMINPNTGFDIVYQENKAYNLRLAATKINHLIINPHEVFSFWNCLKDVEDIAPYKDGLCIVKGEMQFVKGGGLCQLSNILFYLFLNGPFKIIERHNHQVLDFLDPNASLKGIDATVAEGYLDLKVENIADYPIEIAIDFIEDHIFVSLRSKAKHDASFEVINKNLSYTHISGEQFETVDVYRLKKHGEKVLSEEKLYTNVTKILYEL